MLRSEDEAKDKINELVYRISVKLLVSSRSKEYSPRRTFFISQQDIGCEEIELRVKT